MITTREQLRQQKRTPFYVKEDNPARKNMKHADAVLDNARLKDERDKLDEYASKLKDERSESIRKEKIKIELSNLKKSLDREKNEVKIKEIKARIKVLKESSPKREDSEEPTKTEKDKEDATKFQAEIDKLEEEFAAVKKGPGSKARKDELREKINALKG